MFLIILNCKYLHSNYMYITFFFFGEGSQNISSLGNRNVYYPVYFRLWGEEKHSKFRFSDAVIGFETKTYNIPHNTIQGLHG